MSQKYAIEIENVTRTYKRDEFEVRALDNVTIKIPPARFVRPPNFLRLWSWLAPSPLSAVK